MLRKNVLGTLFVIVTIALTLMNQLFIVYAADNPVPAPTGPYKVGVVWRHWVDESRDETFDEEPHGKREMMVQFLYPADDATTGETAGYPTNPEILASFSTLMTQMNINLDFPVERFADFKSYAYPNAALSDDQASYPVLIFSHGAAADVNMYTTQIEELASHGYIVAAINHAYGGSATVFPDGRIAIGNFATGLEPHVPVWAQDQIFVIDQLETINADDPENRFTGRLDMERLGVFGQSLGGSAATITCYLDSRCKAGAAGDSPIFGEVIEKGLDQPFYYMLSDSRIFSNPEFFANTRGPYYEIAFAGFEHLDFGDFTFWPNVTPLHEALWLGSVEPERAVELTRAYLLAFFDKYLKGNEDTLEAALSAYPEITVTSRNLTASAEAVLTHHLQAIIAHDLDAVMSDYAGNAVLFTPSGVFSGHEQIRAFFTEALNIFTPEVLNTLKFERQDINGEYVYLLWSAGETIPFATDTFYIRDGKIVMQSFAAQFGG